MVGTIAVAIAKAAPFENRTIKICPSKSLDLNVSRFQMVGFQTHTVFESFLYLNVQY